MERRGDKLLIKCTNNCNSIARPDQSKANQKNWVGHVSILWPKKTSVKDLKKKKKDKLA